MTPSRKRSKLAPRARSRFKSGPAVAAERLLTEAELRRIISDAGFLPVQRDTLYRTFFLHNN